MERRTWGPKEEAQFAALVRRRWVVSLLLTAVMLVIYFGFIFVLAFGKSLLMQRLEGGHTLGIPVGFGISIAASLLTGVYVWWANSDYDHAVRRMVESMRRQGNE